MTPTCMSVRKMKIVFNKKKNILLGEQLVSEHTLLEWKPLFSIKLFYFHPSTGVQDRFHTHAFNAVSFLLKGSYIEEVIKDGYVVRMNRNRRRMLCIPAGQYHRITRSLGRRTLLITGPWGDTFKELRHVEGNQFQEVLVGEGRVDISKGRTFILEGV